MKTLALGTFSFFTFVFLSTVSTVSAADTNPPPRLTVELRDGSRVIGTSAEKNFKFHSALLGEIKLAVNAIRSVECVSSNAVKLITTNGDSLTVSFVDSELAVKTSFGKVNLQVNSIRHASVSGTRNPERASESLVAWWPGEGNANDVAGSNNGILMGSTTFSPGMVGQAFNFNGASWVEVPDTPSLRFTKAMTVEAWVKLRTFGGANSREIVSKFGGPNPNEGTFTISIDPGRCRAYFIIITADGGSGIVYGSTIIPLNQWVHLAGVYDGDTVKIYVNGQLDGTTRWSGNIFPGNNPLTIGCTLQWSSQTSFFNGLIDEVRLYACALSADEIREDYDAGDQN